MLGKLAIMTQPEELEYREYEVPSPGPGAIVVRVLQANVCGSELHIWRGLHPLKKRGGLGHEMVGAVAALGEGVTTDYAGQPLKVGDRVVATYFQICMRCRRCLGGQYDLCDNAYEFFAKQPEEAPHFFAAFATHIYIYPRQHFYKVPDDVPNGIAASANCALSQVYYGLDQAGLGYGETVVIQGAGGLGLVGIAIAKTRGARVIIIDSVPRRLEQARKFGADHILNMADYPEAADRIKAVRALTEGQGADVAVEVTGVPAAFTEGLNGLVRRGGRYLAMGNINPGVTVPFDPGLLARTAIRIIPVLRYDGRYLYKALRFLSDHKDHFPFADLLDAHFSLDEVKIALDKSARREVTRATIVMES